MDIAVCDYTGLFDDPTRAIVSPVTCKFVMLKYEETDWLVVGRLDEFAYHALLVHRFSKGNSLNIRWVKFMEMAEFATEQASIHGGGWMKIDLENKTVRVYGTSTAYGTAEYHLVATALAKHPDFGQFSVLF